MLVTPSGIVTLVREVQPSNALSPMLVTPSGIVTLVREVQSENVLQPIHVTPSGIVTLVREVQPKNARSPIYVTGYPPKDDGIVIAPLAEVSQPVIPASPLITSTS